MELLHLLSPFLRVAAYFVAAFAVSLIACTYWLRILRRKAILDVPNERSNHTRPTPRGGGLAVNAVILAFGLWLGLPGGIIAGALVLMLVCWLDDLWDLHPFFRLLAQGIAVAVALSSFKGPVFGGYLPEPWDVMLALMLWMWFINLFNFMDGIDGIAATEASMIGLGGVVVALIAGIQQPVPTYAAVLAGASGAFLMWNWHPARVFLGDVGSVPLGLLTGYLLISLAHTNVWEPAVILPLYFVADATLTLISRLRRKQKIWQAHSEHYYQRAVRAGVAHSVVVRRMIAVNVALIVLAASSALTPEWGWAWILAAAGVVGLFLRHLYALARKP